jgi:hypothetical protein
MRSEPRVRVAMRWAMAAFYLAAGTAHLVAPEQFLPIVPDFVPIPREVALATGLCELAGGLALLTTRLRRIERLRFSFTVSPPRPRTSIHNRLGHRARRGLNGSCSSRAGRRWHADQTNRPSTWAPRNDVHSDIAALLPSEDAAAGTLVGAEAPSFSWITSSETGARPSIANVLAAAGLRSITRPATYGPRSLILTTAERPLL